MAEVFTWIPDDGPSGQRQFRTLKVQFGDGYTQRAGDGLNTASQDWNVKFDRDIAEIAAIESFLDAHEGHTAFLWTPPKAGAAEGLYVCEGYTTTPRSGGQATLSARFIEYFAS